jgi:hypothetical protein
MSDVFPYSKGNIRYHTLCFYIANNLAKIKNVCNFALPATFTSAYSSQTTTILGQIPGGKPLLTAIGHKNALMEHTQSSPEGRLPEDLVDAISVFLSSVPVARLSKNLRNLFLSQMYNEMDTPSLNLEEQILDLQALFDLLDIMERAPAQRSKGSSFL